MAEQKRDLIQFAASQMAQPRASAPKVMWGELLYVDPRRRLADDLPALLIDRKSAPSVTPLAFFHASTAALTHVGMGTVRMCPALPARSAMTQCSSSQLDSIDTEREQLAATKVRIR